MRSELLLSLSALGIRAGMPHQPEPGGALQCLMLGSGDPLAVADALMVCRYAADQLARRHGLNACFLPRPCREPLCAGLAVAQSLWKAGHPLFGGEGTYADLSQTARWYLGGLLRHGASLAAFTNPGTNSYRRLRSGGGAPTRLCYARHDPTCVVSIPISGPDPARRRLVLQQPDGLINPYLAFSALLLAGLDGIQRRLDPGPPSDLEPAGAAPEAGPSAEAASLPGDLGASLDALAADHDYLLAGGVFGRQLLEDWIAARRQEVEELEQRPHPHEFSLDPSRCVRGAAAS
jgi:glutamine synthetase